MSAPQKTLLMIPGPVEMSPEVQNALASHAISHVAPGFVEVFGRVLKNVRSVFLTSDGQPFVLAGSGSIGWDMVACNCLEMGDEVLVLSHGYFGDAFRDVLVSMEFREREMQEE